MTELYFQLWAGLFYIHKDGQMFPEQRPKILKHECVKAEKAFL